MTEANSEAGAPMTAKDDTTTATPTPSDRIDTYLAALPPDMRDSLQALRGAIAAAAPEAVEAISYSAPAFRYRGRPLVAYSAAKHHCSFFPMNPAVLDAHRDGLRGYDTAKGTIRFPPGQRLPAALVTSIVRARMAETDAASKR